MIGKPTRDISILHKQTLGKTLPHSAANTPPQTSNFINKRSYQYASVEKSGAAPICAGGARGLAGGGKAGENIGLASPFISTLTSPGNLPDNRPGSHLITPLNSKPNDGFTLYGIAVINARIGLNLLERRILSSR
jgi:hypothetical protein